MREFIKQFLEKLDILQFVVCCVVMTVFFVIINALIYREIPEGNREILVHVLGIVEGAVMTVVSFYYGSSKGSQKKNDIIANQSEQLTKE